MLTGQQVAAVSSRSAAVSSRSEAALRAFYYRGIETRTSSARPELFVQDGLGGDEHLLLGEHGSSGSSVLHVGRGDHSQKMKAAVLWAFYYRSTETRTSSAGPELLVQDGLGGDEHLLLGEHRSSGSSVLQTGRGDHSRKMKARHGEPAFPPPRIGRDATGKGALSWHSCEYDDSGLAAGKGRQ